MIRLIFKTLLLAAPVWLLYFALMTPLVLIGFPLVAVAALVMQFRHKYIDHTRATIRLHWPTKLLWLWDNDEDGIDGDPWFTADAAPKNPAWFEATARWSAWRRIFVWSAWRNSVGNARWVPFFGVDMPDPKDMQVWLPQPNTVPIGIPAYWNSYRKTGPYLARYGWRFELKFCWNPSQADWTKKRLFWIGWRIAQQDSPAKGVGFAFQPWGHL